MFDRNYVYDFALDDFMTYLNSEYDINGFSAKMLYNALLYADVHFHSLDDIGYFISELTDVPFEIVAAYVSDEHLTDYGKQCKKEYWLNKALGL